MARNRKTTPEVDKVRPYVEGVAKSLVDRLYGPNGPPWGTRLTELEDVVLAVREMLSERMLDQALQRQADASERPPEYQACPGCGQPVRPQEPEPRLLQTRGGEAEWQEPHTYCRKCRQAFFPSEQEPGDRSQ
jgi:hypothetical protein